MHSPKNAVFKPESCLLCQEMRSAPLHKVTDIQHVISFLASNCSCTFGYRALRKSFTKPNFSKTDLFWHRVCRQKFYSCKSHQESSNQTQSQCLSTKRWQTLCRDSNSHEGNFEYKSCCLFCGLKGSTKKENECKADNNSRKAE